MADKKLPPEGARWEIDDWKPSDSDQSGKLDTYIKRLEKAETEVQSQAKVIQDYEEEVCELLEQLKDYKSIREGRDARVAELESKLHQTQNTLGSEASHGKKLASDLASAQTALATAERKLETQKNQRTREQGTAKKDLRNHKLIIGGVVLLLVLMFWAWASAMNSKKELQEANNALTSSNKALESDQRSSADLRSEISSLKSRNQGLANQVVSLQSSLSKEQQRAQSAIQREAQNAQRGEMPGTAQSYPQVRSMFLSYINGLPAGFGVESKYVACVRGGVLDELERAYSSTYSKWSSFKKSTKRDFEGCKSQINYKTREATHGNILNDYMYKEDNFLDQVQRKF